MVINEDEDGAAGDEGETMKRELLRLLDLNIETLRLFLFLCYHRGELLCTWESL
jgi:hypothetical protein